MFKFEELDKLSTIPIGFEDGRWRELSPRPSGTPPKGFCYSKHPLALLALPQRGEKYSALK